MVLVLVVLTAIIVDADANAYADVDDDAILAVNMVMVEQHQLNLLDLGTDCPIHVAVSRLDRLLRNFQCK